jgi:hypothetical protein
MLLPLGPVAADAYAEDREAETASDLVVEVVSQQALGSGYIQVEAYMRGTITRLDGSQGTYKVPTTLVYPTNANECAGMGLIDVVNSVFYETFPFPGTDPNNSFLVPVARVLLGDDYIKQRGYVYALAQWNKLVIERQRVGGTLPDNSLHIDEGEDGYYVLRDLSGFLRMPSAAFVDPAPTPAPTPCAVDDVMAWGYSQTGMLLRHFYFAGLNTALVNTAAFDGGQVFEGAIHGVPGSHCRRLDNDNPWFAYSFMGCGGVTPSNQGKVITINTETDVQIVEGWKARPADEGAANGHYRVYELAGTSHLPTPVFPLSRPADRIQNYADTSPVLRAMTQHLQNWIEGNDAPPPNAVLQGHTGQLAAPLFSNAAWGSDGTQVRGMKLGEDGNVQQGVRLPHVRTVLPGKQEIGAPLGVYRGTECNNDPVPSDFILGCVPSGDESIYNVAGGMFKPYTEINGGALCSSFYESYESYTKAVQASAEYAVANGWVLAEELESLVDAAEQKAGEYPGCVPPAPN